MYNSALLNHHGHNCITVHLPPLFVYPYNLVYPDVTHKITGNENEIVGDDTMGVNVAESVPRRERLLSGDNWYNLET
jgi:hypothetical protein